MSKLKLIDKPDKFLIEVDGTEIPHVTTYTISRNISGCVVINLALSVNSIDSMEIEAKDNVVHSK